MKFLIADDHSLFRAGIRHLLTESYANAEIIEASSSHEAIETATTVKDLNLILMDLRMPDIDGIRATEIILSNLPTALIVILTASEDQSDMRQGLQAGAVGYLAKSEAPEIIISALRLVLSGGIYIPPSLIAQDSYHLPRCQDDIALTPRQTEVLKLLVDGQSNKRVAQILNLTEPTVKNHISAIFRSLGVNNRTQAAVIANKLNLI